MPWNTTKYLPKFLFKDDKSQRKPFTAERLDESVSDIAEGITNTLNINGSNMMLSALKMNNNKIVNVAKGTNPTDVATLEQISGGVFATDNSTDNSTLDLTQAGNIVQEYKDGLVIKFKAKKNSVNNMQIRLNNLGYKNISSDIGVGSWIIGDTVSIIYDSFLGVFKPNDERNKTKNALTIDDFNNYIYPTKLWVNGSNASNAPEQNYGFLEVKKVGYKEGDPNADCVQIFYVVGNVDNIYYRRKGYEVSTWTVWYKLSNNTDIASLQSSLSQIHALAVAGTQSGNFKFMLEGDP